MPRTTVDMDGFGQKRPAERLSVPGTAPPQRAGQRVLVVDDYPTNVELLAANLSRLGYEVVEASGGSEALELISRDPPDVVLLDIVMPNVSGLDVLRRVRQDVATADLPIILVSGLGDTDHVVEGLALGANDYVTKPIEPRILHARLATQAALKRARDDLKRTALLLAAEIERNAVELDMAAQVQRSILPRTPTATPDLDTAWYYCPATEVGGDLFDIIALPNGRTLLFVADAMGHGVQAALVAAAVKATLAAHLDEADDLALLMTQLDRSLSTLFVDRFVTAVACVVDASNGRVSYITAGHPPLLMAGPERVDALSTGGLPLGTALPFRYESMTAELPQGAQLLLFSDGLLEAQGRGGRMFGLDTVAGLFLEATEGRTGPAEILDAIRTALAEHRGERPLEDDLTILAAGVAGTPAG